LLPLHPLRREEGDEGGGEREIDEAEDIPDMIFWWLQQMGGGGEVWSDESIWQWQRVALGSSLDPAYSSSRASSAHYHDPIVSSLATNRLSTGRNTNICLSIRGKLSGSWRSPQSPFGIFVAVAVFGIFVDIFLYSYDRIKRFFGWDVQQYRIGFVVPLLVALFANKDSPESYSPTRAFEFEERFAFVYESVEIQSISFVK
jgi:hypothetical protein